MTSDTIRLVARLKARPDKVGALHAVLFGLLAPTRAEQGCIRYEMLQNLEDPTDFTFIEEWSGQPAIDAHFGSEHIREALAQFPILLADELDVRGYSLVG